MEISILVKIFKMKKVKEFYGGDTHKKILNPIQVMNAWNKLNGKQRQEKTEFHFPGRKHTSLNGTEIKKMF